MAGVYLVSLEKTFNQTATSPVIDSMNTISELIKKKICGKLLIVSSPKKECIDCTAALSQILRCENFMIISNFHDSEDYKSHQFVLEKNISSCKLQSSAFEGNYQGLFNLLQNECDNGSVILVVDEVWYEKLNGLCGRTHIYGPSKLSMFRGSIEQEEEKKGVHEEQVEVQGIQGEKEMFFRLQQNLSSDFQKLMRGQRTEILQKTKENLENTKEATKVLKKSVRKTFASSNNSEISMFDLDVLEKEIQIKNTELKSIKQDISKCDDIASTYQDQNLISDEDKIKIKRVFFDKNINAWRIRILNNTEVNFHDVDVYIVESKEVFCSFAIIQAKCKMWKVINIEYSEEIYGIHLIAMSQNLVITKEPFMIAPMRLICDFDGDLKKFTLTLKNYSDKVFDQIAITITDRLEDIPVMNPCIQYKEKTVEEARFEKYQNMRIYAFSGNQKITGDLDILFE